MVMHLLQVVWTANAQKNLKQIYGHIKKDSLQNAAKVTTDILSAVSLAAENPEVYGPDKYKINNDGSFRAFEKHHYRLAYKFSEKRIRVLRVRHTSMEPLQY